MTPEDLFATPESLSPYEAFKRRHNITTAMELTDYPWTARIRALDYAASAQSEKLAVYYLAKNHELAGWRDLQW